MKFKVLITRKIPEEGLNILEKEGIKFEVWEKEEPIPRDELKKRIVDKQGLFCLLTDKIDRSIMEASKDLKIISNYAVGYDNIDVKSATELKILVTNTPGVLTDATAELAWALIFSVARRIVEADSFTRSGKWKGWAPLLFLGKGLTGKTLGIIGAGRIGERVGLISKGLNMNVLYYDKLRNNKLENEVNAKKVSLEELLKESDVITIHVSLNPETKNLIGWEELNMMKKDAILINTARGQVVDEKALIKALKEGVIAGAGLDVFENEPFLSEELVELKNVVLLPHIGSGTKETRTKMAQMAAEDLVKGLKGEKPKNIVNPEVFE